MTIEIKQPKRSRELLAATEATLRAHQLRLKPNLKIEHVLSTLEANQCTVEAAFGQLAISQHGAPVHVQHVMEGLARQRGELFFPRDIAGVKSRDEMDAEGKVKFIREKGLRAFEQLPQKPPAEQPVVLDENELTKKAWLTLDLKTRAELAGTWGHQAIAAIMQR